ncbi:MAG: pitrilysin family protein [Vicinamibacterales bacterium]
MRRPRARVLQAAAVVVVAIVVSAQAWPVERPPAPLPDRPVAFPPYEIRTLDNGLQVLVVPHHEQPAVSFRLLIKAGAAQEPSDRPGVASVVAGLLAQGTTTRSAGEIATEIDSAGGFISAGSGNELSNVSGAVVKDRTDLALGLAADLVEHPAFAPEEIDRQRRQVLSALQVNYDDPDYLANLVFDRLVFGDHPYGRPTTPESVSRITRDDLVAYHRTWFVPNNALLAIVGDLTVDEAFAAARRAFGGWQAREVPVVRAPAPPAPVRRLVVVDRPGSAQTEIRVGHLGVARTHPDYVALDLLIRILGGEGANRLFGVLRSEHALTYGASADLNTYKASGSFVAETDTRTEATVEALRLMVDEVWRLQREPVDAAELEGAERFLSGNFPLTIETPAAIAEQVLVNLFYGIDLREIETYRERVNRVSPDDIQRVARAFLQPDHLAIVLVGDAAAFVPQLRAAGFDEFERIPIADLDLNAPSLRRSAPGAGGARD